MNNQDQQRILLAHGGGGQLSESLIRNTILPRIGTDDNSLPDSAKLDLASSKICFTTDSYVVKPLFFNGGDIGKLAACGTINDLAVAGAKPIALSLALIIEEGLELETLERILESIENVSKETNVPIVTGDTKTVEKGAADQIFINTAGVGVRTEGVNLGFSNITPGDCIILSGTIGDHGMTILSQRKEIEFQTTLRSDCAPLSPLIMQILEQVQDVKFMRDPTRGGLAATLNEICAQANVCIELNEPNIPVDQTVQAAADVLGLDVLNIANEGKFVTVVSENAAEEVLRICRDHALGEKASIIGKVTDAFETPTVEMITRIGGRRIVQMPYGRDLPRIC